jgi:hypothetical protein
VRFIETQTLVAGLRKGGVTVEQLVFSGRDAFVPAARVVAGGVWGGDRVLLAADGNAAVTGRFY